MYSDFTLRLHSRRLRDGVKMGGLGVDGGAPEPGAGSGSGAGGGTEAAEGVPSITFWKEKKKKTWQARQTSITSILDWELQLVDTNV